VLARRDRRSGADGGLGLGAAGRRPSFGFSGLHFHDNWRKPEYRRLAAQAVLWTLKKPIPPDGLKVEVTEEDLKAK